MTRRRADRERAAAAQMETRRILLDALILHPDVFRYLAEQAADLAGDFPRGSRYHLTLALLDQAARGVADMLEAAEQAKAKAS